MPASFAMSSALATASAAEAPPTSMSSQPWPAGSSGTAPGPFAARTMFMSRESMPSTASGLNGRTRGTASAASNIVGYPRASTVGDEGTSPRETTASVMVVSVPSVPTRNFARFGLFSGSRCSIAYAEAWREKRPNSVRMTAR